MTGGDDPTCKCPQYYVDPMCFHGQKYNTQVTYNDTNIPHYANLQPSGTRYTCQESGSQDRKRIPSESEESFMALTESVSNEERNGEFMFTANAQNK